MTKKIRARSGSSCTATKASVTKKVTLTAVETCQLTDSTVPLRPKPEPLAVASTDSKLTHYRICGVHAPNVRFG